MLIFDQLRVLLRRVRTKQVSPFVLVGLLVPILSNSVFGQASQPGIDINEAERMLDLNVVELEDQLVKGLRLVTQEQKAYVHTVVQAVRNRQIPRAMVNVVFVWSKERNPKYPFPYFQIALRHLAKQRGVNLP